MRKKVIKAHRGMAHVPRADGADRSMRKQGPTKGRGRPPTGGRMIGLPQTYRGGGKGSQSLPAWAKKALPVKTVKEQEPPRPIAPPKSLPDPTPVKPVKEPVKVPTGTGFSCPSPDTLINLNDNKTKQAGDLAVGDIVHTQHETTLEWGDHAVSHVSIIPNSKRLKLIFDTTEIVCSLSHKMYVDNKGWVEAKEIEFNDVISGHTLKDVLEWETGDVVKITVEEAHTYIAAGLLSHNKRYASPTIYKPPTQTPPKQAIQQVVAPRIPRGLRAVLPQVRYKGGYISRAKYGIVDNLKEGKK